MDKEQLKQELEKHARETDIKINPNSDMANKIIDILAKNIETKGKPYCPCRVLTGDAKKDALIVCPCAYHLGEIELQGRCHCNLFWKI